MYSAVCGPCIVIGCNSVTARITSVVRAGTLEASRLPPPVTSLFPQHCHRVTPPSLPVDDASVALRVPLFKASGGHIHSAIRTRDHFKESSAWHLLTFVARPVSSVGASFSKAERPSPPRASPVRWRFCTRRRWRRASDRSLARAESVRTVRSLPRRTTRPGSSCSCCRRDSSTGRCRGGATGWTTATSAQRGTTAWRSWTRAVAASR